MIKAYVGVIGSGKDYAAKKDIENGYVKMAFADKLREIAWESLGFKPENEWHYNWFKNTKIFGETTGREFLQNLGESIKKNDPDYFVRELRYRIQLHIMETDNDNIVITDARFPREVEMLLKFNTEVCFTNYKSDRYEPDNPHISEKMAQGFLNTGIQHMNKINHLFKPYKL